MRLIDFACHLDLLCACPDYNVLGRSSATRPRVPNRDASGHGPNYPRHARPRAPRYGSGRIGGAAFDGTRLCVDGLRGGRVHMRGLRTSVAILTATITISLALTSAPASASGLSLLVRTLDGSQNNRTHPSWGQAGTQYLRVGQPNYADGISAMVSGPSPRYVSNRVFNDRGQNIFSEAGVTNWGWVWGQFLDHDIGLRDETSTE